MSTRTATAALALLAAGCAHSGVTPRTAEIVGGGDTAFAANYHVATLAPGSMTLADGRTMRGFTGFRDLPDAQAGLALLFANVQIHARTAFTKRAEIGVLLGLQEQGAELRLGVLGERWGAPLSLAVSAAATWRPFMSWRRPWYRVGIDLSRRFGRVAPLLDVYATWGPESHAISQPGEVAPDPGPTATHVADAPQPYYLVTRDELRVQAAIGVSIAKCAGAACTFGIVPYWTALARAPDRLECVGCSGPPIALEEKWGATLVMGLAFE